MTKYIKSRNDSESGYTMQTLIIIAILVLAATTAAALLYAILRDSTSRIAGGSETFDGLPSGPQNLRVESEPSGSDVDVTVSWEAPSYLGEFPLIGYELSINEDGVPMNTLTWNCGELDASDPDFTYDNQCEVTVSSVDEDTDYDLVFTINLGSADARSSPGGISFYRDLDLSTQPDPPDQVETVSLPDALAVSWEAEPNITYRLHVELAGGNYYQCFNPSGGRITREIPDIRGRGGYQSTANTPVKGTQYTVMLSAASSALTLNAANCSNNENFGRAASFTGIFGIPSAPEITLETDLTRTLGTDTLPSLKATLASCDADSSTTFFWEIAGQPQTQNSHTIQGCGSSACTSNCALTIYEDFAFDTEYEVWAVAKNTVGTSNPSERQRWIPTRGSTSPAPGPPRNITTVLGSGVILVSWDAPAFIPEAGIRGYILRWQAKPPTDVCPDTLSSTRDIAADSLRFRATTQENHKAYCFQLSAFTIDSNQAEAESEIQAFEAVYVNPLSRGANEFLLDWRPNPRAEYYTVSWSPLTSDKTCTTTDDITASSLQPSNFLSAAIPYNGEETLTYTIPAIWNTYYLVRSTATLQNGATVSWQTHICTNLYNAPTVGAPSWTGTTTAGTAIGLQWTKPDETAGDFDTRYSSFSYALRTTTPGGTQTDECIPFGDSAVPETTTGGVTTVSYTITSTSVAGDYNYSLTVAPTSDCSNSSDATSIIDSPPAATPPIRTSTSPRTIM